MTTSDSAMRPAAPGTGGVGAWLPATPLAADGAPVRTTNPNLRTLPVASPVLGRTHDLAGVSVREVTFVHQEANDVDVVVHLNGLTDNHRENIEPALLHRVPATDLRALTYLLPDDGTWSYRYVVRDRIPHDVGVERSGWLGIHADGRPDPLNAERLRHPHGEESSVLRMPGAPRRSEWPAPEAAHDSASAGGATADAVHASTEVVDADPPSHARWHRLDLPALTRDSAAVAAHYLASGAPDAPLLVLFDAEQLIAMPVAEAFARYRHAVDVLLLESGTSQRRAAVLPHPDLSAASVRGALSTLAAHEGRRRHGSDVIVSGVSYGGLAAASVVVHDPSIAQRAIVQSGSFWYHPDRPPRRDDEQPGALVECVAGGRELPGRRFVIHVGTDEGTMALGATQFAAAAESRCADVSLRQYRGGHDWAWWSHALFDGLDELLDV